LIRLQALRRTFESLKMRDNEEVKDFSNRVTEVVNQLRLNGDQIKEERVVQKILISVPEKFDSVVAAIEESKDLSKLSVIELFGSLSAHEQRILRRKEDQIEEAFRAQDKQKGPVKYGSPVLQDFSRKMRLENGPPKMVVPKKNLTPCGICNLTNHLEKDYRHKGKPQCRYCKRFGHVEWRCKLKFSRQNTYQQSQRPQQAHVADN